MSAWVGAELEKKTAAGVLLTLVIIVFVAVYWATEPARHEAAAAKFKREAMARGAERYVEACAKCHGTAGQGLVGPALKGTRLDERTLEKTITRGVPRTALPAWGEEDGGPFKTNQIHDLATFIQNWDDSMLSAGTIAAPTPNATPGTTTPPATSQPATPPSTSTSLSVEAGRQLFSNLGCAG
ncbi:MAG: cytochrome c, partial [Dehalococcoidia bacterium]|nr:cytochrome c [Dehalococcoidia bacterium]